jgi:hypothetical protein
MFLASYYFCFKPDYNFFSFNILSCSLSNSLGYILDNPQNGQNSISGHVPFFVCLLIKMLATPAQWMHLLMKMGTWMKSMNLIYRLHFLNCLNDSWSTSPHVSCYFCHRYFHSMAQRYKVTIFSNVPLGFWVGGCVSTSLRLYFSERGSPLVNLWLHQQGAHDVGNPSWISRQVGCLYTLGVLLLNCRA